MNRRESSKKLGVVSHSYHKQTLILAVENPWHPDLDSWVGEQVLGFLDRMQKKLRRCSDCGGLQPDIIFDIGNRRYCFTCTKITDEHSEIIAKTDYEQLESYCHSKNMCDRVIDRSVLQ